MQDGGLERPKPRPEGRTCVSAVTPLLLHGLLEHCGLIEAGLWTRPGPGALCFPISCDLVSHLFSTSSLSDIVNCDLKSTLRVLYNLFTSYRNVD